LRFEFRPVRLPLFTRELALMLLKGPEGRVRASLSLGKDFVELERRGSLLTLPDGREIDLEAVAGEMREGYVYALEGDALRAVAFYRGELYYRLLPVGPYEAPTLEISGIRMHRTEGITPWRDAELKVRALGRLRGREVLDICTGLGYTAIHALLRGAAGVLTIEKDPNVLEIASYNPWSHDLASERIEVVLADAAEYVSELDSSSFDAIIHDPPRLARAGELYSTEFYRELYRVLRRGGRLFHYTGKPGYKVRGIHLMGSIAGRLKAVGFKVQVREDLLGVLAQKL